MDEYVDAAFVNNDHAASTAPREAVARWNRLRSAYAAGSFTSVVGELHTRQVLNGLRLDRVSTFAVAAGDRWRIEDDAGALHIQQGQQCWVRGVDGALELWPGATVYSAAGRWPDAHPHRLFGSPGDLLFDDPHDFSRPVDVPTQVTVAGRAAWEFLLEPPPGKPSPLYVALDSETGICLRTFAQAGADERLMETSRIQFDPHLAPSTFSPSESAVALSDNDDQAHRGPADADHVDPALVSDIDRKRIEQLRVLQQRADDYLQSLLNNPNTPASDVDWARENHQTTRQESRELLKRIANSLGVDDRDLVVGKKSVSYEPSSSPGVKRTLWTS